MEIKTCRRCRKELRLDHFYRSKRGVYQPDCKECFKERMAARREGMREELRAKQREYVKRNKEKVAASTREWAQRNAEKRREYARKYYWANHKDQREKKNQSLRRRIEGNPSLKLRYSISRRLSLALNSQGSAKHKSVMAHIGCSLEDLKAWLESKFRRGMSWGNYGKKWHVDHVIPCSAFDLTIPEQLDQCWHFTNLQPLEALANLRKSNKITQPQMNLRL